MRVSLKRMIVCVSILAMVSIGSANGLVGGLTSSNNIIPRLAGGNPTCSDIAACTNHEGYNIEQPDDGDYSGTDYFDSTDAEVLTMESFIVQNQNEQNSINGSSNVDVNCVIMKGANEADIYGYTPPARSDTVFTPPINSSRTPAAISQIIFYYDDPGINLPEFPSYFLLLMDVIAVMGVLIAGLRRS